MTTFVSLPAKHGALELASPLGIGTNQWTDETEKLSGLLECAVCAAESGTVMLDSAEIYQGGASERAVGVVARDPATQGRVLVATKHMPLPWHFNAKQAVENALTASLARLQVPCIDLYYLHMANTAFRPLDAYADAFANAVDAGLVRAVGVSNFSETQLRQFHARLALRGVPLAAHQVEFSLARRGAETAGMLEACRELGIAVVAWAPLGGGKGRLTSASLAKLEAGTPIDGITPEAATLLREVGAVAKAHSASAEEVAIAWTLAKGALCLLGTRKRDHAAAGFQSLQLRLTDDDLRRLDAAALDNDGMYNMLMSKNVVTRALSKYVLVPLLQDPLPKSKL